MATTFDITGRINAIVSSGSLRMLRKLQTELRATANALLKMGETTTASALGHTAMALDRVAGAAGKAAVGAEKMATTAGKTAKQLVKLKNETKAQSAISKSLAKDWKLNVVESQALTKAVGMLGKKYTYAANAQKEWVPAIQSALTGINKQKAALVASGKAITTHITSTELFDRVNRKLALGADKVKSSFTDYGTAMEKSLGRSMAFRGETTKIAKAFGVQGEAFKKQFAALTKVDDAWRTHVTNLHRAGKVTTEQAQKMYNGYQHLGVSAKELQARIKASNGELRNAATYNKDARAELVQHAKSMGVLVRAEEKLAAVSGKSIRAVQGETEALMKRTKSFDATVAGINKQAAAYSGLGKAQVEVVKKEQALAKATGARVSKIQEITKRMRAQGITYRDIGKHLDALNVKHAKSSQVLGRVSKASDGLRKSNKQLAGEIDALGRIRTKNLAATQASAKSLEGLARKYPQLSKQVSYFSQKVAAGSMSLGTADKLLNQLRGNMGKTTKQTTLFGRAMSSLVAHLKSFASYAAAATIISGVAGMFGLATRAIIKYDQALHDLKAITRATDDEVALMGEKIREVGRTTKFSASEVAVAMRTLGQAGFTASEAIESISDVANLATGTLTSMSTVVDLVTTAVRAFDLEATQTGRVADIFANAVNRSKLTIDKLRIAFNYIGPIAAKTGITLEETASTTMMLANAGIRASTIGTGLRRTFQQLIEPTKELKAAIEAAGYTVEDFNPQMNDMRDIVRRLTEIVPDAEAAFRMFSLRSSAAVAALSSQGVASFDALHSAVLRSGTAAEMAETQMEGLGIIFKQAWDKAHDLALAFGEAGVTGTLRVLGKTLQVVFDGLRIFVSSGIGKAIIAIGSLIATLLLLSKIWVAIKMSAWASAVVNFAVGMQVATVSGGLLSKALLLLQSRLGLVLVGLTALYGIYKLLTLNIVSTVEAHKKYIKNIDEANKKELERLETIKRWVSIARDETASSRERQRAFTELTKRGVTLNLMFKEGTKDVEDFTQATLVNKDALDEAAQSFGNFNEKIKMEKLEAQIKLFEETDKAIEKIISNMSYWEKLSEKLATETAQSFAKIPILGGFVSGAYILMRKKIDACREGIKKLEGEQSKTYEKMVTEVISFGEITQEVWKDYMLNAGASEKEVAKLFVDGKEKITRAHVDAYKRIQDAREDMTAAEKEESERHIKVFGDLFDKLNNTTARRLEKDLNAVREHYSEREKIITKFYDSDVLYLKGKLGFETGVYEKLLGLVGRQAATRLSLLKQQYDEELALIKGANLGMIEEQERRSEQDKKYANRKLALEREVAEIIRILAEEQLEILTSNYEKEAERYDESIDKRIDSIDRYYENEKRKVELQSEGAEEALSTRAQYVNKWVEVEASASLRAIGVEHEYIRKRKKIAGSLYDYKKNLAEKFVNLELQRVDKLTALEEEAKEARLAAVESYHKKRVEIIEVGLAQARFQFEQDDEKRVKIEGELNAKLIEIDRSAIEARIVILQDWADYLESQYDGAIDKAREYGNKVIEIEIELKDIRKKTTKAITSVVASTEDQLLRIRRAGMTKTQLLWSKVQEANRKMAEANRLLHEVGTAEALANAKKLFGEAQSIYTDLGVQARGAAKAGKNIGISFGAATDAVIKSGTGMQKVLIAEEKLATKAKQAEVEVAKQAQKSWADLARDIKEEVGSIQEDIVEMTGFVEGMVSSIETIEDKEVDVGIDEGVINESIRLVGDLWTNIDDLEDKTITITTNYVENRNAGGLIGKKFDSGGPVPGSGSEDTVPAMLTPGEFVVPKDRVVQYGLNFMESIKSGMLNAGRFFKFGFGGLVKNVKPAENLQPPSGNIGELTRLLSKMTDKLNRAASGDSSKEPATEGAYNFNINIGGASLKGTASKSVLDQFQLELRRQELAGGLA